MLSSLEVRILSNPGAFTLGRPFSVGWACYIVLFGICVCFKHTISGSSKDCQVALTSPGAEPRSGQPCLSPGPSSCSSCGFQPWPDPPCLHLVPLCNKLGSLLASQHNWSGGLHLGNWPRVLASFSMICKEKPWIVGVFT